MGDHRHLLPAKGVRHVFSFIAYHLLEYAFLDCSGNEGGLRCGDLDE